MRRRVLLTAKATLFENPVLAAVLRTVGVVPLRRAKDERDAAAVSASRNSDAFRMVTRALERQGAVLVFPEGISHDEPSLAPLRTGAARMALTAAADGVRGVRILPFGMIFEEKERPRSRVLVRIDEPIDVDEWLAATGAPDAIRLTADIDSAMRHVTLNFASEGRARRAIALARALASIAEEPFSIGQARPLATEAELAHRIDVATDALASAPPETVLQADVLITRVESLEARLAERHVALTDVHISPRMRHGARFVLREGVLAVVALPFAVLGRITHWIPLRLARMFALRTAAKDPSRDQPAMRTIVLGLAFVLLWYVLQGVLLTRWFGVVAALLWLTVIFLAARIDFVLRDRLRRGWSRARSYLALRADPAFRETALQEIQLVVADALALEQRLVPPPVAARR
jgi:hypothetical protein